MPYKLRKAPKRDLYWVITVEDGKKHSKLPIPLDKAKAQMRVLESALSKEGGKSNDIIIPKKAFVKEHNNLLKVLASNNPKKLKAEAKDQAKELKKVLKGGAGWSKLLYNKVQEYKRQKTTPEQDNAIALIYNGAMKALKEEGKSLSLLDKLKGKKRNPDIDENKKFIVNNALDQMNSVFQNSFDIVNPLGRITNSASSESTGMPAKHTSIKYSFSAAGKKKKRGGMFNPLNVIKDKKQAYDKLVDELTQVNEQPAASIHSRKSLKSILDSVKQKLRGNEHGIKFITDLQTKLESEEGYDDYKQRNKLFDKYIREKVGGADEGSDEELARIFGKVDIKDKEEDKKEFKPIKEKFKPKPIKEQLFEAPPKKRALKYSGKKRLASEVGFEQGYGRFGGVKIGDRYRRNEVNLEDEDITELLRSGTHDEKVKKLRLLLKSREHLEKNLTKPREHFMDLVKVRYNINDNQDLEPKEWIFQRKNFIAHNNLLVKESKLIILIFKLQQNLNMITRNVMLREINKFERKIISINEENIYLLDELREAEAEQQEGGSKKRMKGGISIANFKRWIDLTENGNHFRISVGDINPLSYTHEVPDEDDIILWDFLMNNTTDMDKLRLDKMELLQKLYFLFFGVWSLGELYNEFKINMPELRPFDHVKDTIESYYGLILNTLIGNITEVLDPQKGYDIEDTMIVPEDVMQARRAKLPQSKEFKAKGKGKCKAPYHDRSKGKASVFALTCIDPRYTFDVAYFLQHKKELHADYDLFTSAGASVGAQKKEWTKAFMDNLELGIKLHGISEVWCFDHLDCGMYKATFGLAKDDKADIHIIEMDKLGQLIKKKHPELKFRKFLVSVDGHVEEIK